MNNQNAAEPAGRRRSILRCYIHNDAAARLEFGRGVTIDARIFWRRDLVDEGRREQGIELNARGAAIAGAAIGVALFADLLELRVNRGPLVAHGAAVASDVPNGN